MASTQAEIVTERASRYLVQFCKHAAAMGAGNHRTRTHHDEDPAHHDARVRAQWTETSGVVDFPARGQATLTAGTTTLTVRIEATDDASLRVIQDVLSRDLIRFGRRERLEVMWQPDPSS